MPINYDEIISFNEFNMAPYNADHFGIYKNDTKIGKVILWESLLKTFDSHKYRIGLMSDIHYNDYTVDSNIYTWDDDSSEYSQDITNALSFYQNNESIEMIMSAGDITTNDISNAANFKQMLNVYAPTTPFYSCLGNHDFKSVKGEVINAPLMNELGIDDVENNIKAWLKILVPESTNDLMIFYEDSSTDIGKTSFWFEKPIEPGSTKTDIFIFLSLNYDNNDSITSETLTNEDDNMQEIINYVGSIGNSYNLKFYKNSTLLWLKNILELYPNKRIFIFNHLLFSHKAGQYTGDANYYKYSYGRIHENSSYCLCGIQFEFLNKLNNEYKNTIWFTGHSHLKWNWQQLDSNININNKEYEIYKPNDLDFIEERAYSRKFPNSIGQSGYNVHLPSICRPLQISDTYNAAILDSEGAILDIYENYVDIRGIVFKEGGTEYINKYYPLAQYRINIPAN